jgi:hypothetical protein
MDATRRSAVLADGVHAPVKVELVGEAVDEQGGVDGLADQRVLLEAQQPAELQEHRPEHVHVRLHDVREVDEHVRPALLATHDVQTRAGDLLRAAAAREVSLHGELVQSVRRACDVFARADA